MSELIAPPITGGFAHADPNASPLTLNELIDILNPLLSMKINGNYIPYLVQHGVPGADQTSFVWFETDTAGRPLGVKIYYNGHWRRVYNGMVGEIRMYSGNPGDTTIWTSEGHGVVSSEFDGWQICNGKNGSPDLTDAFIVGAHMNDKDGHNKYNNGWQSFVNGKDDLKFGGSKDHMIVQPELPPFNDAGQTNDVMIGGHDFKDLEETPHPTASVYVGGNYGNQKAATAYSGFNYGSSPQANQKSQVIPQVATPTLPPFIALGFIVFQGYTT